MAGKSEEKGLAPIWFKFFLDAGIPPADAGNYAVTFTENRIQPEMMIDLTKEYLAEMGITVLGDVIGILKHARVVHAQTAREKALKYTGLGHSTLSATTSQSPMPGLLASRNSQSAAANLVPKGLSNTVPVAAAGVLPKANHTKAALVEQPAVLPLVAETAAMPAAAVRRVPTGKSASVLQSAVDDSVSAMHQQSSTATVRKSATSVSAVESVRQRTTVPSVLPASVRPTSTASVAVTSTYSDGARKLVSQQKPSETVGAKKSTIFDRLGSEVRSNPSADPVATGAAPLPTATTMFTVTLDGANNQRSPWTASTQQSKSAAVTGKLSTIFSRLGGKNSDELPDETVSTTAVSSKLRTSTAETKKPVLDRLGPVKFENVTTKPVMSQRSPAVSAGVLSRHKSSSTVGAVTSAKARLGPIRTSTTPTADESRTKIQLGTKRVSAVAADEPPSAKVIRLGSARTTADNEPSAKVIRLGAARLSEPSAAKVVKLGTAPATKASSNLIRLGSAAPQSRSPQVQLTATSASTVKRTMLGSAKTMTKIQCSGNGLGQRPTVGNYNKAASTGLMADVRPQNNKDVKSRLGLQKTITTASTGSRPTSATSTTMATSRSKIIRLKPSVSGAGVFGRLGNIST